MNYTLTGSENIWHTKRQREVFGVDFDRHEPSGKKHISVKTVLKGKASDRGREAVVMYIYCHWIYVDTNREIKTTQNWRWTEKKNSKILFPSPVITDKNPSESNMQLHFSFRTLDTNISFIDPALLLLMLAHRDTNNTLKKDKQWKADEICTRSCFTSLEWIKSFSKKKKKNRTSWKLKSRISSSSKWAPGSVVFDKFYAVNAASTLTSVS